MTALNPYTEHYRLPAEQALLESLTTEFIKINGVEVFYIRRNDVSLDRLFGEDPTAAFNTSYLIEAYFDSINAFEGQGDLMTKFGIDIKDSAKISISKRRFYEQIACKAIGLDRPRMGDLIYFPLSGGLFEITHAEYENLFYQVGKVYTYQLTIELFNYSQETFNTGIEEVDDTIADLVNDGTDATTDPFADNEFLQDEASNYTDDDDLEKC